MADLIEQHRTLVRRGMPELIFKVKRTLYSLGVIRGMFGEEFARDSLTMRAMRWIGQVAPEIDVIEYRGAGTVILDVSGRVMGANASILEAIVDATEYLEPANA